MLFKPCMLPLLYPAPLLKILNKMKFLIGFFII